MDETPKLTLPAVLAVVVLSAGCTTSPTPVADAGADAPPVVADAGFDAGCVPPEVWDPVARACIPIV